MVSVGCEMEGAWLALDVKGRGVVRIGCERERAWLELAVKGRGGVVSIGCEM